MIRFGSAMLALCVVGCLGTESGNPPLSPTKVGARTSDASLALVGSGTGAPVVTEAWVSIREMRVIEGAACDVTLPDRGLGSLIGNAVVGIETDGLPTGDVCGVRVAFGVASEAPPGAPAALAGRSVLVLGQTADGTPFEIASEREPIVNVATAAPTLAFGEDAGLLLTLDVARWLGALDLSAVPAAVDGVVRIEPGHAGPELSAFEAGFEQSLELFADPNADGTLDATEEAAGPIADSHTP